MDEELTREEIDARTRVAIKCMCRVPLTPLEEAIRDSMTKGWIRVDEAR